MMLTVTVAAIMTGCATDSKTPVRSVEEQVRYDNEVGRQLAARLEPDLVLRTQADLAIYLRKVASRVVAGAPGWSESPIGILMIDSVDGKWTNFSLPGAKIYLSTGLLKKVEYENELAAMIAFEAATVSHRLILSKIESDVHQRNGNQIDFFGPFGVLSRTLEDKLAAAETAVEMLYRSGYDPRGLVEWVSRYRNHPVYSPWTRLEIDRVSERIRLSIAKLAPLLNPTVQTDDFIHHQARIKKL